MKRLFYCYPAALDTANFRERLGNTHFNSLFKLNYWAIPIDRSGTITTPLRTVSLFPIPEFRPFSKDYEEICDDRASSILKDAERMGVDINVLYSGGIDSTLLLVSLLKRATAEQRKHIVVLLSHESIAENPRFYDEHIRGKLRVGSSITFPELIGGKDMLLSAEHNDQLMGSDLIKDLFVQNSHAVANRAYDHDTMFCLINSYMNDVLATDHYLNIVRRLCSNSPVNIVSNADVLWWINFCMKWQASFFYLLFFVTPKHAPNVTKEYIDTRYISFYNTDEFQLWSMNNLNKRIRDTWKSYKWVCKDIIYDYTKDAEYRDHKTKVQSVPAMRRRLPMHYYFLDDATRFYTSLLPEECLVPQNDFM